MSGFESAALIGGTLLSAGGEIAGGIIGSNVAEAESRALRQQAAQERAAAQREAIRRAREARLLISRQRAVASASGGSATDPTVLDLMGEAAAEGAYQKAVALFEGEARARGLENQAAIRRQRGRQAMFAGFVNAGSQILTGISNYRRAFPNSGSSSQSSGLRFG